MLWKVFSTTSWTSKCFICLCVTNMIDTTRNTGTSMEEAADTPDNMNFSPKQSKFTKPDCTENSARLSASDRIYLKIFS